MYRISRSSADRATNQMRSAAGTLSAMTKKQEITQKDRDLTAGDVITNAAGVAMVGSALSENDWVEGLFKKDGVKKAVDTVEGDNPLAHKALEKALPETAAKNVAGPGAEVSTEAANRLSNSWTDIPGAYDVSSLNTMSDVGGGVFPQADVARSTALLEGAPTAGVQTGAQMGTGMGTAQVATTTGGASLPVGATGTSMPVGGGLAGSTLPAGVTGAGSAVGGGLGGAALPAGATGTGMAVGGGLSGSAAAALPTGATSTGMAVGGGLSGGAAGGSAGATTGASAGSIGGPAGIAIGAAIGLAAGYLFS